MLHLSTAAMDLLYAFFKNRIALKNSTSDIPVKGSLVQIENHFTRSQASDKCKVIMVNFSRCLAGTGLPKSNVPLYEYCMVSSL